MAQNRGSAPPFPNVSEALLEALDRQYPAQSPKRGESHEDLLWRGGERSVVEFLRQHHILQAQAAGRSDGIYLEGALRT